MKVEAAGSGDEQDQNEDLEEEDEDGMDTWDKHEDGGMDTWDKHEEEYEPDAIDDDKVGVLKVSGL